MGIIPAREGEKALWGREVDMVYQRSSKVSWRLHLLLYGRMLEGEGLSARGGVGGKGPWVGEEDSSWVKRSLWIKRLINQKG